jgi:selenocysteine lyase/cysteine desulfurase
MSFNTSASASTGSAQRLSASINLVRQQFPALDRPAIFLDNPAGTQITRCLQLYGSHGHRKGSKVTFWNRIPAWVMGYNHHRSPISFSEFIQ